MSTRPSNGLLVSFFLVAGCVPRVGEPEVPAQRWELAAAVAGVPDVDAALAYYCGVLKFVCSPELTFAGAIAEEGSVYAIVSREGARIHLQIRRQPQARPVREAHEVDFIVAVSNADAVFAEFGASGVSFVRPIASTHAGTREFTIEDPFGNRAAFESRTAPPAPEMVNP